MSSPDNFPPLISSSAIRNHSRLGIASFIVALLAILIICANIGIVLIFQKSSSFLENYKAIDAIINCFTTGLTLAGLGLGIASITQKDKNRVFGILGLVFNSFYLLGICGLYLFNIITLMNS